ncbi:MAG: FAA hydrolase family protein [Acidobacteria bacterium]|nr:MAG: FAA hydrolase family protein [Acidobacteriota bacterium]
MIDLTLDGRSVTPATVYALGRNYAAHAREMGAPAEPVVFLKPRTALAPRGGVVPWPEGATRVDHEVELVLLLGTGGRRLDLDAASRAIAGVAIGIDLTARDLQAAAKRAGAPWARAKGFPGSAPVSEFVSPDRFGRRWETLDLELTVGGEARQRGSAARMLLDPPRIVALLSRWFALEPGDVVFTGTPEGVGPVEPGRPVRAACRTLGLEVEVRLAAPADNAAPGPPPGA